MFRLPIWCCHCCTVVHLPFSVVPQKAQGEFRLINYLSCLCGSSVSDAIDPDLCTVKYASFDAAVSVISKLDNGTLLAK